MLLLPKWKKSGSLFFETQHSSCLCCSQQFLWGPKPAGSRKSPSFIGHLSSVVSPWSIRCSGPWPCSLGRCFPCPVLTSGWFMNLITLCWTLAFLSLPCCLGLSPKNFAPWVNSDARHMLLAVAQRCSWSLCGKGHSGKDAPFSSIPHPFSQLLIFYVLEVEAQMRGEDTAWKQKPWSLVLFFPGSPGPMAS